MQAGSLAGSRCIRLNPKLAGVQVGLGWVLVLEGAARVLASSLWVGRGGVWAGWWM